MWRNDVVLTSEDAPSKALLKTKTLRNCVKGPSTGGADFDLLLVKGN